MPGTLVRDALAPTLVNATNLTATATGTGVEVNQVGPAKAFLKVSGTISGTSPTLDVTIQASDVSNFGSGVVTLGRFAQVTAAAERFIHVDVQHKYVRAVSTVGGTTPSFGSVVCTLEETKFRRTKGETA